jgi:hypothetical protein
MPLEFSNFLQKLQVKIAQGIMLNEINENIQGENFPLIDEQIVNKAFSKIVIAFERTKLARCIK